jgi:hypothetical protein
MKKYSNGFDYDGTITAGLIPADKDSVVITGRGPDQEKYTRADLEKIGLGDIPIVFFPGQRELVKKSEEFRNRTLGEYKAKTIKKLGVKTYYEDNPEQAKVIKELMPDVNVILVNEMKTEKRLKYLLFSYENIMAGSVAYQLQREKAVVNFAEVKDVERTLTDDELKSHKPSHSEYDDRRLTLFNGMLNKLDADKVLAICEGLPDKEDYFIFTDKNDCFRYTEKLLKMGFTKGNFPTQEDRMLEVDRDKAKDIVKQHYPGIKVKDYKVFKTVDEGVEYMKESKYPYVLKSMGDQGETVVPKTSDLEINRKEVASALLNEKAAYEERGFLLEQKIMDGVEITPECFFWNGKPVYFDMDLEVKTFGGAESGSNVGCGLNLIIQTKKNDKINQLAFPPYVYESVKDTVGMRMMDVAIIIDPVDNGLYFLEFCPNRVGWDSFPTQITMGGGASNFFEKMAQGENPLQYHYGTAVRLFNDTDDHDRYPAADMGMVWKKEIDEYVFPYDVKAPKKKEEPDEESQGEDMIEYNTAGAVKDAAVVTCADDSIYKAICMVYDYVKQFSLKDALYRSKDDFLSFSYPQAILARLEYMLKLRLIDDKPMMAEVAEIKAMPHESFEYGNNNKDGTS